jgi:PiT family inorganic phosphate transporter
MSVGNTVAKTVDNNAIDLWVILAGLLAATFWNLLTWWLGIPSSSSHTLIGGFAGAAVAHAGFGVIESGEILKVVLFIFLAPIIGGFIAYLIAVVTISRSFWKKMLVILLLSGVTVAVMEYMIEYIDMKPIMMYIVIGMIAVFILVYIWFELVHGSKPSAVKEANMHKKLQLLSSAAFSLGHGGADSQKVMGIICAALLVYGNMGREGKLDQPVPKDLRITELMQIEFDDTDGKKHKFKPEVAEVNGQVYYIDHKEVIDAATGTAIYLQPFKMHLHLKQLMKKCTKLKSSLLEMHYAMRKPATLFSWIKRLIPPTNTPVFLENTSMVQQVSYAKDTKSKQKYIQTRCHSGYLSDATS